MEAEMVEVEREEAMVAEPALEVKAVGVMVGARAAEMR